MNNKYDMNYGMGHYLPFESVGLEGTKARAVGLEGTNIITAPRAPSHIIAFRSDIIILQKTILLTNSLIEYI